MNAYVCLHMGAVACEARRIQIGTLSCMYVYSCMCGGVCMNLYVFKCGKCGVCGEAHPDRHFMRVCARVCMNM